MSINLLALLTIGMMVFGNFGRLSDYLSMDKNKHIKWSYWTAWWALILIYLNMDPMPMITIG